MIKGKLRHVSMSLETDTGDASVLMLRDGQKAILRAAIAGSRISFVSNGNDVEITIDADLPDALEAQTDPILTSLLMTFGDNAESLINGKFDDLTSSLTGAAAGALMSPETGSGVLLQKLRDFIEQAQAKKGEPTVFTFGEVKVTVAVSFPPEETAVPEAPATDTVQ